MTGEDAVEIALRTALLHSGRPGIVAFDGAYHGTGLVLDEVPRPLERVGVAGERFERAGWHGQGLLRVRPGDCDEALRRGVLVVPAGEGGGLISATPALTISDAELDEAFGRLA